jgi:hypothetical protein
MDKKLTLKKVHPTDYLKNLILVQLGLNPSAKITKLSWINEYSLNTFGIDVLSVYDIDDIIATAKNYGLKVLVE